MSARILDLTVWYPDLAIALLPEIVLALLAMTVLLADVMEKGNRSRASAAWVPWLALASLAVTFAVNAAMLVGSLGYGPMPIREVSDAPVVAVDAFRFTVNAICLIAGGFTILLSMGYLDRRDINRGEFHALVLFAVLGMMLMAGAADLMLLFIGLEVMSVAVYVLVGFDRRDRRSSEAALKYFLLGAFTSAFFLYGIALVFGATGTTNIRMLGDLLLAGGRDDAMLVIGMALVLVGFAFKVAAVPFHMWAPDAYDGAPTPVTTLMATGVKAAAFAALLRVFTVAFLGGFEHWASPLYLLAAVTMIVGNLVALTQGSVKRMLAYSSIAHAGYLLAAVLAGAWGGAGAFVYYAFVYTLMTAGAFGILIANARDGVERVTLEDWSGFASQKPWLAAFFSIFLLSLAGFPLTAGFIGKLSILRGLVEMRVTSLAVVLVLASLVSYFYYLRVVVVMYMRPARTADEHRAARLPAPAFAGVATAAVLVVLLFFTSGIPWGARTDAAGEPRQRWSVLNLSQEAQRSLLGWAHAASAERQTTR
jgi:NADH-quinone oxidoreductase subunit N